METEKVQATPEPTTRLDEKEIDLRKRWLEFGAEDEALIEKLDECLAGEGEKIIDNLYAHFLSFHETRAFFADDEILKRAQAAQRSYFTRLLKGNYDAEYVKERLKIGKTHYEIGLDPKWYIGAYSHVLSLMLAKLPEHFKTEEELSRAVSALMKLIFFDMGLAIDTYISAKESDLRNHKDMIDELETERRVVQNIHESAPVAIVNLTGDFKIKECNNEFLKLLGINSREQLRKRNLFDLAPNLDRKPFKESLESGEPRQGYEEALTFAPSFRVGQEFYDWSIWPVKDPASDLGGLMAMFVTATDRVLLHQQREDFVATLTHDLKTPILATNRAIELLMDGDFGPVSTSQKELLVTVKQSNDSMYEMVRTLLDVYRYDSGEKKLKVVSCDLGGMINQLISEYQPLAKASDLSLVCDVPDSTREVKCDKEEIRRVVQNLVSNSLKFTPAGGQVTVSLLQNNGNSTVSVKDTGKGIADEDKPKLFQRFWQAASSGRYYASTGLGLYLCRKIVESHKGRIWCTSTLGKGSTFSFTLPGG